MENLGLYERVRVVPEAAKKAITGGRLIGKTEISPMWRIKTLTEEFGVCGFGWKYTLDKQWIEAGANGAAMAFCNITLYIKLDGEWSDGIIGTGGAAIIAKEASGLYSDDEAYKKALTDALSVACKAIGMGADVYWNKDSKYSNPPATLPPVICTECGKNIKPIKKGDKRYSPQEFAEQTGGLCYDCYKKAQENV